MRISDKRSIIIILFYVLANLTIIAFSFTKESPLVMTAKPTAPMAPEFTVIENLDYFHLKNGIPQLSLTANRMNSQGEERAEFDEPKGVYNYQKKNETLRYQAAHGVYQKQNELLVLRGNVKITSTDSEYYAEGLDYFFKKDLLLGTGGVKFIGEDLNTRDTFNIQAKSMEAQPQKKLATFTGNVKGVMKRKKKYEGNIKFASQKLNLDSQKSLAHLEGNVVLDRPSYLITAGKADIHFENYNKSLKYFVLNDDVKVTETVKTPKGITERKSYSERLEGFGREQKMVLSGAPRVEQGTDVIKGYRITIRENADLIEVDDAMSDVQVKRKEN
jgi:LPS export ABC transporter protein LptC/lipopolysaccharide transport protein LptA